MATDDTLTLVLDGEVSLDRFAVAIREFKGLVYDLSDEVATGSRIRWVIDSLQAGSAFATVRGSADRAEDKVKIPEIIHAYERVGRSLQDGSPIPFSAAVAKHAHAILRVIDGGIRSVRFETSEADSEVTAAQLVSGEVVAGRIAPGGQQTIGAVRGRVQSISNRGALRFTLYDQVEDRAISCYVEPGLEEIMRDAWGKQAVVQGVVRRNPITGCATTIRHVGSVRIVPDGTGSGYREALGAAPILPGEMMPEDAIRKLRDA